MTDDPLYDSRNPNHSQTGGLRDCSPGTADLADRLDAALQQHRDAQPGQHGTTHAQLGSLLFANVPVIIEALRAVAATRQLPTVEDTRLATIEKCAQIAESNGWEATAAQIRALSSTDHEPGCQSGDFGPCDCSLSRPRGPL